MLTIDGLDEAASYSSPTTILDLVDVGAALASQGQAAAEVWQAARGATREEAEAAARRLDGTRARGRALSRIAGAWMDLDPARACRLLADLRRLGRPNFLDGLSQLVPGAARLGGPALVWRLFEAVEATGAFFE